MDTRNVILDTGNFTRAHIYIYMKYMKVHGRLHAFKKNPDLRKPNTFQKSSDPQELHKTFESRSKVNLKVGQMSVSARDLRK